MSFKIFSPHASRSFLQLLGTAAVGLILLGFASLLLMRADQNFASHFSVDHAFGIFAFAQEGGDGGGDGGADGGADGGGDGGSDGGADGGCGGCGGESGADGGSDGGADGGCGGCGGDSTGGDVGGETPSGCGINCNPPPSPAPTCVAYFSPATIAYGGNSTFVWSSSNATNVFIDVWGNMPLSGSQPVLTAASNKTIYVTATGPGGTAHCQATLIVQPQVVPPACTLSANPTSISTGGYSTLSWSSSNAVSASLTTLGGVPLTGSAIVNPAVNTAYTLTVTGTNGQTVTCQALVTVTSPPAPSCTLVASPTTIQNGGSTALNWTSQNAVSASFNQGIGSVAVNGSRTETNITSNRTYVLTVTSASGQTATCQAPVSVTEVPHAPSCTLNANPNQVQSGGSTTLTWTTANAASATLNHGIGSVALNGSRTETNITANRNYVLTVVGTNGQTINCETNIVVTQIPNPPSCTLYANPTQVQSGGSSTLYWTSSNGVSAEIDEGIGSVAVNGSYTVSNITDDTSYKLTVTGRNGETVTCHATVTVTEIPHAPSCTLSANPNSVQYGGSATLTWSSNNAVSATIDNGVGSVGVNGSNVVTNLTSNRTYTLTVTGQNGQTATCQAPIVVQQINVTPSCTISASQNSIQYGQSVTLYWSSTNASYGFINPNIGAVGTAGSMQVSPQGNTTYTLTVTGTNGQTITCQTPITVTQVQYQAPYCSINANPTWITQGQSSILTWSSQNAQSAQLSSSGSVGVNGSMSVSPYQTTTYTLTVWNAQGQQATCSATVQLNQIPYTPPPIYHPPTYYPPQPTVYPPIVEYYPPSIPISYIPYTGSGGPLGNIVLFGLIVIASLSGAYLILYSRGGAREMLAQAGILRA